MRWVSVGANILLAGSLVLSLFGALTGFSSSILMVTLCLLLLAQIVVGLIMRVWGIAVVALVSFCCLGLWAVFDGIHHGVLIFAKFNKFSSNLIIILNVLASVICAFLFVIAVLSVVTILKRQNVSFRSVSKLLFSDWTPTPFKKKEGKVLHPDLKICRNAKTGRDVKILGNDRYLHMLVIGPTGGGKTALSFEPFVYQDIEYIAKGNHACVVIMEPDGAFTRKVSKYAEQLNVSCIYLDVTNPRGGLHWNPLEGTVMSVAERVTTVLSSTGTDNPYFKTVQQSASRNVIQLLKFLHEDDLDLEMVTDALRDMSLLKAKVTELELKIKERDLDEDDEYTAKNVVKALKPKLADRDSMAHYSTVCDGLIEQLNNLIGNPNVRKTLCGKSSFTFDEIYQKPGVLLINTGNDVAGDLFGMFALLSMQDATLSRPGDENTRTAVNTYIDEYGRYATKEYKTVFTQGRKYRNSHIIAIQSFSQLKVDDQYKEIVKTNTRNKIILTGLEYEDAREASLMLGMKEEVDQSISYGDGGFFTKDNKRTSERRVEKSRFSTNDLMFMDKNSIIYKIVQDRQPMPPDLGVVDFAKKKTLDEVVGRVKTKEVVVKTQKPRAVTSRKTVLQRFIPKVVMRKSDSVHNDLQPADEPSNSPYTASSEVAASKATPPPVIPLTQTNRERKMVSETSSSKQMPPPVVPIQSPPPIVPVARSTTPPLVEPVLKEEIPPEVEAETTAMEQIDTKDEYIPPIVEPEPIQKPNQEEPLPEPPSEMAVELFEDEEINEITPYLDDFLEDLDEVYKELLRSIADSGTKFKKSLSKSLEVKGLNLDDMIADLNRQANHYGFDPILVIEKNGNVIGLSSDYLKEIVRWARNK